MDTLPAMELADYLKVKVTMIQIINLSPEAFQHQLRNTEFGLHYLIGQKIRVAFLRWLRPKTQTKDHIVDQVIMVQNYTTLLPFQPKNLVLYPEPPGPTGGYDSSDEDICLSSGLIGMEATQRGDLRIQLDPWIQSHWSGSHRVKS